MSVANNAGIRELANKATGPNVLTEAQARFLAEYVIIVTLGNGGLETPERTDKIRSVAADLHKRVNQMLVANFVMAEAKDESEVILGAIADSSEVVALGSRSRSVTEDDPESYVGGTGLTLDSPSVQDFGLRELYEFQEATGYDTAAQFLAALVSKQKVIDGHLAKLNLTSKEFESPQAAARWLIEQEIGVEQSKEIAELRACKDEVYLERNQVVAALAKCFPSGVAKTAIEGWSEDWYGCVYIDLPTGQVSWHFHDSQAYLFKDLPSYEGAWDGHDTPEKYRRVNALAAQVSKPQPTQEQDQRERRATRWDAKAFDFTRYFAALQRTMLARNASAADVSRETGVSNTTLTRMKEGRRPDAASLAALSAWAGLNPAEYVRASPDAADFDLPAQSDEVAAQAAE